MSGKLSVRVEISKPWRSKTLRGFADVFIPELHLRIIDCTIHELNGKRWISLPGKPQLTRDKQLRCDERGKTLYTPVLEFTDKPTHDAFSQRAVAALLEAFPNAFDDGMVA